MTLEGQHHNPNIFMP